jgi:hypothetical protein
MGVLITPSKCKRTERNAPPVAYLEQQAAIGRARVDDICIQMDEHKTLLTLAGHHASSVGRCFLKSRVRNPGSWQLLRLRKKSSVGVCCSRAIAPWSAERTSISADRGQGSREILGLRGLATPLTAAALTTELRTDISTHGQMRSRPATAVVAFDRPRWTAMWHPHFSHQVVGPTTGRIKESWTPSWSTIGMIIAVRSWPIFQGLTRKYST